MARFPTAMLLISAVVAVTGCAVSGPQRASDIQNLNGISDDISAVNMTQSESKRALDPNDHSTLPRPYETNDSP